MDKSIAFYTEILEGKIIKDYQYPESRLIFMEVGGTIVELIAKKENEMRPLGPIEHIAFKVEALEDKMDLLKAHGIPFTEPRVVGSAVIIFFEGPNNERFEFVARVQTA